MATVADHESTGLRSPRTGQSRREAVIGSAAAAVSLPTAIQSGTGQDDRLPLAAAPGQGKPGVIALSATEFQHAASHAGHSDVPTAAGWAAGSGHPILEAAATPSTRASIAFASPIRFGADARRHMLPRTGRARTVPTVDARNRPIKGSSAEQCRSGADLNLVSARNRQMRSPSSEMQRGDIGHRASGRSCDAQGFCADFGRSWPGRRRTIR